MKYTATLALFLGYAAAEELPCTCDDSNNQATFYAGDLENVKPEDVEGFKYGPHYDYSGAGLYDSLSTTSLGDIADNYLKNGNTEDDKLFSDDYRGSAKEFLGDDRRQDAMLCIEDDHAGKYGNQYLIQDDATRVNANYESCHVGETIIPAIKEKTNVKQAACYSSDSAAKYNLKGCANNNYKLSGSISQSDCTTQKGTSTTNSGLVLKGNRNKKFCQSGNKAVGGCADGSACGFGLDGTLLDEEALDVTAKPEERVADEVEEVIRGAISKVISDAVSYCLDSSLKNSVQI